MKLIPIKNSQGKRYYGIHFYPGVAEYQDAPDQDPYRVFLNEDTLRSMDPSFAVKPVFVEHVDEVDQNLDTLRHEADGWVIKSFYNEADGKHWVEFIIVSEAGEKAIQNGMRLSNAYLPKSFRSGGLWNGVSYLKEITDAEYEHLAIVKHPRYEESVIMTPDQFKKYNEDQVTELKRLTNSKGEKKMAFKFFKKSKTENQVDPELFVILPKSGKEVQLSKLINEADEKMEKKDTKNEEKESDKNSGLADMTHKVKMHDGSYCNVGELVEKHKAMCDEMEKMKKDSSEKEMDESTEEKDVDSESVKHDDDDTMEDDMEEHPEKAVHDDEDEDEGAKKKALQLAEHEEKEIDEAKKKNIKKKNELEKANAKVKAERLKNANLRAYENEAAAPTLELSMDKVERGKVRYGS